MSRAVSGLRSAIRKATSESWRISLSVSWLNRASLTPSACGVVVENRGEPVELRRDLRGLEVLVRRAVVAVGQRRALARLALPRRRPAARHAAVERAGLDLALDERGRGGEA